MKRLIFTIAAAVALQAADNPKAKILKESDEQFCKDFIAQGVEGWLKYFADDASVFTPEKILTSKAEVRTYYERVFPPSSKGALTWKPVYADIARSGDLGYTYGTWENKGKDKDGNPVTRTGKYTTIWKKQKDGSWKIVMDVGNPDQ